MSVGFARYDKGATYKRIVAYDEALSRGQCDFWRIIVARKIVHSSFQASEVIS